MERTPGYEHTALRGITIKNMIVTVFCTASIVVSVMSTYFSLRDDIKDSKADQATQNKIFELRLKIVEAQIIIIQNQVEAIKDNKK
jgi:hypothetical protein